MKIDYIENKIKSLLDFFIGIFKIKTFMIKNEKI